MALQNEKKAAIRERYKGVDPSLLEVIPATAPETMAVEDRTLNVAAYIRVSTDNDEQTSSFELQQNDFTERIQANPKDIFHYLPLNRCRISALLFDRIPPEMRSRDGKDAGAVLCVTQKEERRSDYTGPAYNRHAEVYLINTQTGEALKLFDQVNIPPLYGEGALYGDRITDEEILDAVLPLFTAR